MKIITVSSPKTRCVVDVLILVRIILVSYFKNFNLNNQDPVNDVIQDTRWDGLSRVIVKIKKNK